MNLSFVVDKEGRKIEFPRNYGPSQLRKYNQAEKDKIAKGGTALDLVELRCQWAGETLSLCLPADYKLDRELTVDEIQLAFFELYVKALAAVPEEGDADPLLS